MYVLVRAVGDAVAAAAATAPPEAANTASIRGCADGRACRELICWLAKCTQQLEVQADAQTQTDAQQTYFWWHLNFEHTVVAIMFIPAPVFAWVLQTQGQCLLVFPELPLLSLEGCRWLLRFAAQKQANLKDDECQACHRDRGSTPHRTDQRMECWRRKRGSIAVVEESILPQQSSAILREGEVCKVQTNKDC